MPERDQGGKRLDDESGIAGQWFADSGFDSFAGPEFLEKGRECAGTGFKQVVSWI